MALTSVSLNRRLKGYSVKKSRDRKVCAILLFLRLFSIKIKTLLCRIDLCQHWQVLIQVTRQPRGVAFLAALAGESILFVEELNEPLFCQLFQSGDDQADIFEALYNLARMLNGSLLQRLFSQLGNTATTSVRPSLCTIMRSPWNPLIPTIPLMINC